MIKKQKKTTAKLNPFFCLSIYFFLTKLQMFFLPMTTFLQLGVIKKIKGLSTISCNFSTPINLI